MCQKVSSLGTGLDKTLVWLQEYLSRRRILVLFQLLVQGLELNTFPGPKSPAEMASVSKWAKSMKQAGAEVGQAQIKLQLGFPLIKT